MKVLITGSKGQLGIALNKLLSKRKDIEIVNTDIDDMDITNIEDVRKVLNKYNPNYVIIVQHIQKWMNVKHIKILHLK